MSALLAMFFQEGSQPDVSSAAPSLLQSIIPFVLVIGIFYLLLIRPEKKRQRARAAMLSNIQKGNRVITTGGMIGTLVNVKEDEVTLEVDQNVRIRFSRNAIAQVIQPEIKENKAELANR